MTATAVPARARRLRRVAPPRRWWADVSSGAALVSLVIVTSLWIANGGIVDLGIATGPALSSLGRLTGLVASDLLLLQVLGMARIPWVERSFGQDRLARWHRLVGFGSFNLMLAHIVLITFGYAATSRTGVLHELWNMVWTYPGMLLATAATGLLIAVVGLSVKAARRRLRYESWHLIHLYAYLGVGLALPHQLWTGSDFITSPLARAYWWGLYIATLGAVLVFRLGLPLWRTARHRLTVAAVVEEAPGVVSVHLRGRALDKLPVSAGQFFVWRFLDGEGWSRAHPYSLSAPPHPRLLRITVKDLGDGSRALADIRPGTRALIEGPYGRLTADLQTRPRVTLMASGIGITPLRALLEELTYADGGATLLYRARSEADLAFRTELDALAATRGVRVVYLTGRRLARRSGRPSWLPTSFGHHHSDAAALRRLVPDIASHDVFICGPDSWAHAARRAALDAGVPRAHVHEERFAW
ncbi:MAG: ferredoxin reductase family protein [Actinomycetes bacterium]